MVVVDTQSIHTLQHQLQQSIHLLGEALTHEQQRQDVGFLVSEVLETLHEVINFVDVTLQSRYVFLEYRQLAPLRIVEAFDDAALELHRDVILQHNALVMNLTHAHVDGIQVIHEGVLLGAKGALYALLDVLASVVVGFGEFGVDVDLYAI